MKYYLDTEFNEFGGDLISLGLVSEEGRTLYLTTDCANPGAWVAANVMPILDAPGRCHAPLSAFGEGIRIFLARDRDPWIIADWPDDIRYFCQALITGPGEMVGIPKIDFSIVRVDSYPNDLQITVQHNALWDAVALRYRLTGRFDLNLAEFGL